MAMKFTDGNFEAEVLKAEVLVIVDFYADWCGPCKMIAPIVDELSKEYEGTVKIGKLDVDADTTYTAQYRVMSIPTILFFKNGEVVDTVVGAVSKAALEEKINAHK